MGMHRTLTPPSPASLAEDFEAHVERSGASSGQVPVLQSDSTLAFGDVSGGSAADATTSTKGIVQLAGDLAGTAASPTVPGLSDKVDITTTVNGHALSADVTVTASDVSAVPTTRTVNGQALSSDVTISASDVSAVPTTRTVNGHALSSDVTLTASDVSAAPETLTQTTQTANYTLVAGDANALVELNSASAVTLTVPPNSSVAFTTGTTVVVRQYGAGQVTIAEGSGVTIRSRGSALKLYGQYSEATLTKRGTDEWVLSGDITS